MTAKFRSMGFPFVDIGRKYDPVEVQIKMPLTFGLDGHGKSSCFLFGPYNQWVKTWVMSAETDYHVWQFLIKHPSYSCVCLFFPENVQVLFEAKPFFYLMKNASRANKLNFFRRAVVESSDEALAFLEMIEKSDLSEKDKRRARTWLYRRQKNLNI